MRFCRLPLVALAAGCTQAALPPPRPMPPVSTGVLRVRVFTEPAAVRALASVGGYVFVGADGLERWGPDGGAPITLPVAPSVEAPSGNRVGALAADAERGRLWLLTEAGIAHYDTASELFRELPAPPPELGIHLAALATDGTGSIAPADDGGAWVGGPHGLVAVTADGDWMRTVIQEPVRALVRDRAGWLWIATRAGLVARRPTGDLVEVDATVGCAIADPRILVELPGDRMLVIGADADGHERLAFGSELAWGTYRALPEVRWDAATRRGAGAVVMGGERMYRIAPARPGRVRPLAREGMRLVPVVSGGGDWEIEPIDLAVPAGATTMATADDQLLIGTRALGTARYRDGDAHPRAWLRRKQMFDDAQKLSVACVSQEDCWIATGARQAWHWNGGRFAVGGPDEVVLAVARDRGGAIYALHRGANELADAAEAATQNEIRMSRLDGGAWTLLPKLAVTTPGEAAEVSFARFNGAGSLWVGLRYHDGVERRGHGIAIVDISSGRVTYHRSEPPGSGAEAGPSTSASAHDAGGLPGPKRDAKKPVKMWPVPLGVVDGDVRGTTAWFATHDGVVRLANGEAKLWTQADGLRSELARAVAIAPNGHVFVATGAGAGVWDGTAWAFPAALRFEINGVVATRNGQVWMATERGIAAWDGLRVRRVDTLRGLAENEVIDVAADHFDRVWARGPGSLTLVSQ